MASLQNVKPFHKTAGFFISIAILIFLLVVFVSSAKSFSGLIKNIIVSFFVYNAATVLSIFMYGATYAEKKSGASFGPRGTVSGTPKQVASYKKYLNAYYSQPHMLLHHILFALSFFLLLLSRFF